ncbi:MAG TPA: ComF family protein [Ktedonobacterales bacterium]
MSVISATAQLLLDLLFPPRCVSCGASGAVLCSTCLASVRTPEPPICRRCGRSLAAALPTQADRICRFCASGREIAHLDGRRAASVYEGAVRQAILALKFRGQRRVAHPLAELLLSCYYSEALVADLIVPIPLHDARRRQRGYDQARLIAQPLGARLRLPVRTDLLVRQRATRAQMTLSRAERLSNVTDAFALPSPAVASVLAGKRVLLVDDVTTTGSTLDVAARALREANPASVWGLAVAQPTLDAEGATESSSASGATNPARRSRR